MYNIQPVYKKVVIVMEMDLGSLIKKCRKRAKMSQEKLADLMHTTQATISRVEQGIVSVEARFLVKVSKVTNSEDVVISALFSADAIMQASQLVPMFIFGGFKLWI